MTSSARSGPGAELPKQVGRYVAFHQIGEGGMARVYLGAPQTPHGLHELVAIKQLKRDLLDHPRALAMFLSEARIAMRLDHPNVVRTLEVVANPSEYYLVMEFVSGLSLLELLRRLGWKSIPRDLQIWFLTQVLQGLEYAHELVGIDGQRLGIVHCDVSPANVIVSIDGQVKLLDFGIAKATGTPAANQQPVHGKLGYIAPEQCLGQRVDPRADLYAVGVMLWEAVACRRRASGPTPSAILRARVASSETPLEAVCPDAPAALLQIARRALMRSPAARYSTAREFREALAQYLADRPRVAWQEAARALVRSHYETDLQRLTAIVQAQQSGSSEAAVVSNEVAPARSIPPDASFTDAALTADDEATSAIAVDEELLRLSRADGLKTLEQASEPRGVERHGKRQWLVASVVAAAAAAALLAATRYYTPERIVAVPLPASAPEGLSVATRAARRAAPVRAPHEDLVELRISVKPAHARIRLDGRLLKGNPSVTRVPRDSAEHELGVTADGYEPEYRVLRFDRDLDMELLLEIEQAPSRPARAFARPPPQREAKMREKGPSPVEERPASQVIEPGAQLEKRDTRRRRKIDENDPYAR